LRRLRPRETGNAPRPVPRRSKLSSKEKGAPSPIDEHTPCDGLVHTE
jgi:hypothetical protein